MISKNKIKYIRSLQTKKYRDSLGVFIAEGPKVVCDIIKCHPSLLRQLYATKEWITNNDSYCNGLAEDIDIVEVSHEELAKISTLCNPQQVLAVFNKFNANLSVLNLNTELSLLLDGVQDPGNLGTIIRIADWFGIKNVICSHTTADIYNPKVIQATMGSVARVNVFYTSLQDVINAMPEGFPVYGTLLEGNNIYKESLEKYGFIVMGNEGKGVSPTIRNSITKGLRIPNFPETRATVDSLNVAVATAIVCAEFRRR